MKTRFESFGMYVPENIVTTDELLEKLKNKPEFDLKRITGIKTRRWRSESEDSFTIALAAARDCLNNSKYNAEDIDIIINSSITRFKGEGLTFMFDPPLSLYLKRELCADQAINFDITNACTGMMNGAFILDQMIKSGIVKNGLIVSGECITPITETAIEEIRERIDDQFASLTVGDCGIAFIMDESTDPNIGIDSIELKTFARYHDLCFGMPSEERGGVLMITDTIKIQMAGLRKIPPYFEQFVKREGLKWEDFSCGIPHQTAIKTINLGIEAVRQQMKKEPKEMPEVFVSVDKYGNTASTAIFLAFYNSYKEGKYKLGKKAMFLTFGSGLCIGFLLASFGNLHKGRKLNS